jgi:hypothetical protein
MNVMRIIGMGLLGALLFVLLGLNLVLFGVVASNSAIVTVLAGVGLLAGVGVGVLGRRTAAR